jgi:DNA-binding NtrC family response regulator
MEKTKPRILAVDDEPDMLETFSALLNKDFDLLTASSGESALQALKKGNIELVLLDIRMPGIGGIETLKMIKDRHGEVDVVMVTASNEVRPAVECTKLGAFDYITKPFEADELRSVIFKALERRELLKENTLLKTIISERDIFCEIIAKSKLMKDIFKLIGDVAKADSTVLITGESGTGKELVAKAIHRKGARGGKPFVAVNCAAIPDNLLESELFGFEAGTFTGAFERKIGKFELADGGTLFLDEIGCMSPSMQAKILRVLEERKIDRIGGKYPIPVDIRVISATNIEFSQAIRDGKFREDLFYRLNIIPIRMPTLRERVEDIPLLLAHFLQKFNKEFNKNVAGFTREATEAILSHKWPGNVRELQNMVERVVVLSRNNMIEALDLPMKVPLKFKPDQNFRPLNKMLSDFEKEYIAEVIDAAAGNQTKAAKMLGLHRSTLVSKLRSFRCSS